MSPKACFARLFFLLAVPFFVLPFLPAPARSQSLPPTLRFTIIPHRSHLGNEQAYSHMITALEEETGFSFTWVGSKTYGDVIEKLKNGQADIGYLGPFSYVQAQDAFGVRLLARTIDKDGVEFYQSTIITRKDSGLASPFGPQGQTVRLYRPRFHLRMSVSPGGIEKSGPETHGFFRSDVCQKTCQFRPGGLLRAFGRRGNGKHHQGQD